MTAGNAPQTGQPFVRGPSRRIGGFTYLLLLFFVALTGVALARAGVVWDTMARRDREAELLFVGEQFRQAIRSYYENSPTAGKSFPRSLEDLLEDHRLPIPRHHLRQIYIDPMTGRADWGLIRVDGGGIIGVYSTSERAPLRVADLPEGVTLAGTGDTYTNWQFSWQPARSAENTANATAVPVQMPVSTIPPTAEPVAIASTPTIRPALENSESCRAAAVAAEAACLDKPSADTWRCQMDGAKADLACRRGLTFGN
ncbi:MAG: type II secretion system protein [Burkholderiales bacterium]|nr:type II secretion system protein [Burkholderiales bacterium]